MTKSPESDESRASNVAADALSTTSLLPDLTVRVSHSPANPTTEDTITFTAVVKNVGQGKADASTLSIGL